MLRPLSTNLALAQIETYSPERSIVAGDFVYVFDGHKNDYIWQQVAEVRVERTRRSVRVVDTNFFFDEALVAAVAYLTGGGI
jgi:hypothetical protein